MVRVGGADLYRSFAYDVALKLLDLKSRGSFDRSVSSTRDVEPNLAGGKEGRMVKPSYGRGSDSFVQRQMRLEKLPRCGFEWISTRGVNANDDETHLKHRCKIVHMRHTVNHKCNCGASMRRG